LPSSRQIVASSVPVVSRFFRFTRVRFCFQGAGVRSGAWIARPFDLEGAGVIVSPTLKGAVMAKKKAKKKGKKKK
jgi:hypothetical protein